MGHLHPAQPADVGSRGGQLPVLGKYLDPAGAGRALEAARLSLRAREPYFDGIVASTKEPAR